MTANQPFPWRAEEVPEGGFWFRSGTDGWDFVAKRRKSDGTWTVNKSTASNPEKNDDHLCYGVPVYAIADGEVIASWRNAPDNPRPGESHEGRLSTPKTIPRSGNFVAVLGDDGNSIVYAHMKTGSVPAALCPHTAQFVADADEKMTPAGAPHVEVAIGSELPASNRQRVSRGQFLGLTGHSGASSRPHLHMHRTDSTGNKLGFGNDRAWKNDENLAEWKPFRGETVGATERTLVILASPLLRRGDAEAGGFGELAMHFSRSRRLVTALTGESDKLKLIAWDLTPLEAITRRGDIEAGPATRIAIAEPRSDLIVTALRNAEGNLQLISWRVEPNGTFTRCADATAGPVSRVALVTQEEGVVVTAVRADDKELKLIAWQVSASGTFTRRGQASAGVVEDVKLSRAGIFPGVVTSVRTESGELKLIAWQVSGDGSSIIRRGDADAGVVGDYAVVSRGSGGKFLLIAVRDAEERLRLILWQMSGTGSISRLSTARAGKVSEVAMTGLSEPSMSAVVACRDDEGRLRLMAWEISGDGKTLIRWGGAVAGQAAKIAITGTRDSGRAFFVTTCADAEGKLKLTNWEANL